MEVHLLHNLCDNFLEQEEEARHPEITHPATSLTSPQRHVPKSRPHHTGTAGTRGHWRAEAHRTLLPTPGAAALQPAALARSWATHRSRPGPAQLRGRATRLGRVGAASLGRVRLNARISPPGSARERASAAGLGRPNPAPAGAFRRPLASPWVTASKTAEHPADSRAFLSGARVLPADSRLRWASLTGSTSCKLSHRAAGRTGCAHVPPTGGRSHCVPLDAARPACPCGLRSALSR